MKILITAGGTSERIDEVRYITNVSTGQLANQIALAYLNFENTQIFYLCTKQAVKPNHHRCQVVEVDGVDSVIMQIEKLCKVHDFQIVVHAMAVSDYQIDKVTTLSDVIETSKTFEVKDVHQHLLDYKQDGKISSDVEDLTIVLKRTPKIIKNLRGYVKDAQIVGFKLLSGVSDDQLFDVAYDLLLKNDCDFVLANDLQKISNQQHHAFLIGRNGQKFDCTTKKEIAYTIVQNTLLKENVNEECGSRD